MRITKLIGCVAATLVGVAPFSVSSQQSGAKKPAKSVIARSDVRELPADQQIIQALNRLTFGAKPGDILKVRAIGLDTASLDIGASSDYPVHVAWLPGGRFGIENLANLEKLPPEGATLFVGAPALKGGSGGPARILALLSR